MSLLPGDEVLYFVFTTLQNYLLKLLAELLEQNP